MNWYKNIEPEVRDLVKLLRNNGWNTTCSCGHEKYIELDIYNMSDVERLGTFLIENGFKEFEIEARVDNLGGGYWKRVAIINL